MTNKPAPTLREAVEWVRFFAGENQWIPCGRCVGAAELIVEKCSLALAAEQEREQARKELVKTVRKAADEWPCCRDMLVTALKKVEELGA